MKRKILACISTIIFFSCNDTLQCERHYIPNGFTGKVTIYFNQKGGQRQYDKDGCVIYEISEKGECFSALPYKEGTTYPNKTFRYFEIMRKDKDSVKEIPEFDKYEYLQDTLNNQQIKYSFFISSGYTNPHYTFEYSIDYGRNYRRYIK